MQSSEILIVLAEIFVAFTGFTGIVAVLGQRSTGKWRPVDVVRFQALLEASLVGLLLAIIPLVALEFKMTETLVWGFGSALMGFYVVFMMSRIVRKHKKLQVTDDPDFVPWVRQLLLTLSGFVVVTQLMNAAGYVLQHSFGGFLVGLMLLLVLCCAMFVLLLRFVRVSF